MKTTQLIRKTVQVLSLFLTILGFFIDFEFTMMIITGLTLISGVFYCGWVCPYGTLQDLMSLFGRTIGLKKYRMPKLLHKYLKYSRYLLFILFTLLTTDFLFGLMNFDPRTNFDLFLTGNSIALMSMVVLISFSLIALVFERPFCNYLCIQGGQYGLMSLLRVFTIKRNTATCINCKKCDIACPMQIQVSTSHQLHQAHCINCFECTSACPVDNTLTFGLIQYTQSLKKHYTKVIITLAIGITGLLLYNGITDPSILKMDDTHATTSQNNDTYMSDSLEDVAVSTDADTSDTVDTTFESSDSNTTSSDLLTGTFSGTARAFRGNMTVEVTLDNGLITDVVVVDHVDDRKWFNRANNSIPDKIIDAQSTDVDVVSGATYSSLGIINAAQNAIDNAQ